MQRRLNFIKTEREVCAEFERESETENRSKINSTSKQHRIAGQMLSNILKKYTCYVI